VPGIGSIVGDRSCFRLSQITWRTSVAHHPTEDIRCIPMPRFS